jgi:hypothetical protein
VASPLDKSGRGQATAAESGEKVQECAIALVRGVAVRTPVQMGLDLDSVFRVQLLVQIFPKAKDYFVTFHPTPNAAFTADTHLRTGISWRRFLDCSFLGAKGLGR